MKKIISFINQVIENRKIKRDFKSSIFGGIQVKISGDNLDRIYSAQVYDSISRSGPFEVRSIKEDVYNWCLKAKGIVRVPSEYRIQFTSESFYFSRKQDAEEFKKVFRLV